MFKMASFTQLLLLGCVFRFGIFVKTKNINTTSLRKTHSLTCKDTISIIFTEDIDTPMTGENQPSTDIFQDPFLVGILEKVVISAKEKGVDCMFDKSTYMLTCCDEGNLGEFHLLDMMELTTYKKNWGHDIPIRDCIFLILNLFFLTFIMVWGFALTIKRMVGTCGAK